MLSGAGSLGWTCWISLKCNGDYTLAMSNVLNVRTFPRPADQFKRETKTAAAANQRRQDIIKDTFLF